MSHALFAISGLMIGFGIAKADTPPWFLLILLGVGFAVGACVANSYETYERNHR